VADADPHPPVIVAALGGDRAQAVVPGIAAPELDAQLPGRKVELVVEDHDVPERDLVETLRLRDRAAGLVHVGLRLEDEHALSA
jgi:hypothetical protein